jgi:hypothetical protein
MFKSHNTTVPNSDSYADFKLSATIFLEKKLPETPMEAIRITQKCDAKMPLFAEKAKAELENREGG